MLTEYTKAPEVTRRRIYVETLQALLPEIRSKIIVDDLFKFLKGMNPNEGESP